MMYPLVVELAAEGIAVVTTCRVLGFSTQAFYKWRNRPYSDSEWADAHLVNELVDLHGDDPEFGYRFLHDELVAAGHQTSVNRVHRLCRENQVWSVFAKKKGLGRKAGPPVHDDLVKRHFTADTRSGVVDRYHRALDRRRQALRVRSQRRLLRADHRLRPG